MATNDSYKLQVSLKTPSGGLINIPADTAEELAAGLQSIRDAASDILATEQILKGVSVVTEAFASATTAPTVPAAVAAPAYEPPPFSPQTASGGPPTCPHGVRVERSGVGNRGEWRAYMCPTPKGTPDQCSPIDAITGKAWGSR